MDNQLKLQGHCTFCRFLAGNDWKISTRSYNLTCRHSKLLTSYFCQESHLGVWEYLDPKEDVLDRWERDSTGQTPVELLGPAGVFSSSPIGLSMPPETSENAMLTTCSHLLG